MRCKRYETCKVRDDESHCSMYACFESSSSIPSADLLAEAAQCLDDCLIRIYPDEFTDGEVAATARRISTGGGTIAYIAKIVAKLRANTAGEGRGTPRTSQTLGSAGDGR